MYCRAARRRRGTGRHGGRETAALFTEDFFGSFPAGGGRRFRHFAGAGVPQAGTGQRAGKGCGEKRRAGRLFPGKRVGCGRFFRCGRAVRGDGCGCGKRGAERNPSAAGTGFRRGRGNSAPGGRAQKRQDHWHSGADLEKIQRGFCPIGSTYGPQRPGTFWRDNRRGINRIPGGQPP